MGIKIDKLQKIIKEEIDIVLSEAVYDIDDEKRKKLESQAYEYSEYVQKNPARFNSPEIVRYQVKKGLFKKVPFYAVSAFDTSSKKVVCIYAGFDQNDAQSTYDRFVQTMKRLSSKSKEDAGRQAETDAQDRNRGLQQRQDAEVDSLKKDRQQREREEEYKKNPRKQSDGWMSKLSRH